MVFYLLKENNLIDIKNKIEIQVNFTTNKNNFLILCALIIAGNRSVPIYFSTRNYPKVANSYDHKKMELAFLRALRHILSKKYQYIIVCDRGFANECFIKYCEIIGFDYVIRIEPNMKVVYGDQNDVLNKIIKAPCKQSVYFQQWKMKRTIFVSQNSKGKWYLMSNMKNLELQDAIKIYHNRFKIENVFKDLKSSGFNIEKSKIKKYDRFKKLLALCMAAQVILVLTGKFINDNVLALKKNYPLHGAIMLAYLPLENRLFLTLKTIN